MRKDIVQIENITIEELTEIISEKALQKLESLIKSIHVDEELLTRAQTSELLKVNFTTLWKWTKAGKIHSYGLGNRVYYKRGELMKAVISLNK